MRAPQCAAVALFSLLYAGSRPAPAQATSAGATVSVTFSARGTVRASAPVLIFDVTDPSQAAVASIDFVAAARTTPGGNVDLIVDAAGPVSGPGGAADVETSLALEGGTEGVLSAALSPTVRSMAARWSGGGRRTGRLVFSLRASAPGTYSVPVSLAVSVP
jgi:hypothetical protein